MKKAFYCNVCGKRMKKMRTPLTYVDGKQVSNYYVCKKDCSWCIVPIKEGVNL